MYDFIIANKEIFKIFYALVIGFICVIIVLRTNRLFQLSFHQGIRYFRNAFFFYGIAFIVRYFLGSPLIYNFTGDNYFGLVNFAFEFFLIMAGFFLLYSLIWKKIEKPTEEHYSSLFNLKIFVFYIMAFIIAILDYLWGTRSFMFLSQVILFFFAVIISYNNYRKNGKRHGFLKFYFIAMILSFFAWLSNALAAMYLKWNQIILIEVYILNVIIFLLFLYGVIKITGKWRGRESV